MDVLRISSCAIVLVWALSACTTLPQGESSEVMEQDTSAAAQGAVAIARNPWTDVSGVFISSATKTPASPVAPWSHFRFPGKAATLYSYAFEDGRPTMLGRSSASSSVLRREVDIPAGQIGEINFEWKVPALLKPCEGVTLDKDDSSARVFLTFEGDRNKFSTKNAVVSELAHLLMGEPLPYATLAYVWSNDQPLESVINSARTDRVRSIVVESGSAHLNQWQTYARNIRADFEKVFGEAPGALLRVAVMTDNDSTCSPVSAWYGAVSFKAGTLQK